MINLLLLLILLGVGLALIKPYVEPALFNLAVILVIVCVLVFFFRAVGLFSDVPIPRIFRASSISLDTPLEYELSLAPFFTISGSVLDTITSTVNVFAPTTPVKQLLALSPHC